MENQKNLQIEEKIIEITQSFKNDSKLKEYEDQLTLFKEMVNKGYVKQRGNNLLPITEKTNNYVSFNLG